MSKTGSAPHKIIPRPHRKTGKFKECLYCHNVFYAQKWLLLKNCGKYCSHRCYSLNKHDVPWNKGIKGSVIPNITSFKSVKRIYKGSISEYKHLHWKIGKLWGKSDTCEQCNTSGLKGKKIHWANLSGEYKLIRSDWKRLCAKCHFRLDYKHRVGFEYGSTFL